MIANCLWLPATWILFVGSFARFSADRRDALMHGSVVFGVLLLIITEGLSAARFFCFQPVLLAWIAATVLSAISFAIGWRKKEITAKLLQGPIPSDVFVRACIGCIAVIACIVGLTAVVSPPNNWDSMTYHMARVANWLEHQTVSHYQTHILRQLYLGPWAEFAVANVQILVGSDRLAGGVQFCSMIGCVVGVSSIAAKLGASMRGQAVAGLFAATLPIMMLEASSTQTDCVAAFWVVCVINSGFALNQCREKPAWSTGCLMGLAVGLAFLTKATTAFILVPFLVWVVVHELKTRSWKDSARLGLMLIALPIAINSTQFYRNYSAFKNVLVPSVEAGWYHNSIHTPGAIVSNILRNILVNTAFRWMGRFPDFATRIVRAISGLDPSDPRITYPATHFGFAYTRDEHDAGNPVHLLIGSAALVVAIYRIRRDSRTGIYAGCIVCAFVLFCYELKWQPWITRLQLPLFVLMAPLVGTMLDRFGKLRVRAVMGGFLFAQSFIYLLYGAPRTLVGPRNIFNTSRMDQYFSKRPDLREPYQRAAQVVADLHPQAVALVCKGDSWEYALRSQLPAGTGIVHVGVKNASRRCPTFASDDPLDVLIQLDDAAIPSNYAGYHVVDHQPGISVLVSPQNDGR